MCEWDGSLFQLEEYKKTKIMTRAGIEVDGFEFLTVKDKNAEFAVLDECSHLFGFTKMGTMVVKNRLTIFDVREWKKLELIEDSPLKLRERSQDYCTYRWLFGLPVSGKELVLVDGKIWALPVKKRNLEYSYASWFPNTLEESAKRLFQRTSKDVFFSEVCLVFSRVCKTAKMLERDIRFRISEV